jgi:hypothetical protein
MLEIITCCSLECGQTIHDDSRYPELMMDDRLDHFELAYLCDRAAPSLRLSVNLPIVPPKLMRRMSTRCIAMLVHSQNMHLPWKTSQIYLAISSRHLVSPSRLVISSRHLVARVGRPRLANM